jgi:hypothetical protein
MIIIAPPPAAPNLQQETDERSRPLSIESRPLSIESCPLSIESCPLSIESRPLSIDGWGSCVSCDGQFWRISWHF